MSSKLFIAPSLAVLMTLAALPLSVVPTAAQVMNGNQTTGQAANITDALARLPASEAVMYFDVQTPGAIPTGQPLGQSGGERFFNRNRQKSDK